MNRTRLLAGALLVILPTATAGCTTTGSEPGSNGQVTPAYAAVEIGAAVEAVVGGDSVLTLAVDEIRVIESCPGRAAPTQQPENGWFVVLDVTASVQTLDEQGDSPAEAEPYAGLGAERFRIVDTDGVTQETTSTSASWACFEDSELLPPFVDLGDTVSGAVVLDSATRHGAVLFEPGQDSGWEWEF